MSDDQIKTEDGAAKTEPNGGSNMAIFHATQRRVYSQPPTTIDSETRRQAAQQMDKLLMLINIAERLPIFSAEIIRDAEEGEAYEVLVRRIQGLHANIDEMAGLAKETKYLPLSEDLCTNQEGSRPMKPEQTTQAACVAQCGSRNAEVTQNIAGKQKTDTADMMMSMETSCIATTAEPYLIVTASRDSID